MSIETFPEEKKGTLKSDRCLATGDVHLSQFYVSPFSPRAAVFDVLGPLYLSLFSFDCPVLLVHDALFAPAVHREHLYFSLSQIGLPRRRVRHLLHRH